MNRSYFTVIPIFWLGLVFKTLGEETKPQKIDRPQKQYFITFRALLFFAQTL
jgi:hypothetical protein